MTKLFQPLQSLEARGTLIDGLVIRNRKRIPHLIRQAHPRQPDTPAQLEHRSLVTALSRAWQHDSAFLRTIWTTFTHRPKATLYHDYLRNNFARLRQHHLPATDPFDTPAGSLPSVIGPSWVYGDRSIRITARPTPLGVVRFAFLMIQTWNGAAYGTLWYQTWFEAHETAVIPHDSNPIPPGTYRAAFQYIDRYGRNGASALSAQFTIH